MTPNHHSYTDLTKRWYTFQGSYRVIDIYPTLRVCVYEDRFLVEYDGQFSGWHERGMGLVFRTICPIEKRKPQLDHQAGYSLYMVKPATILNCTIWCSLFSQASVLCYCLILVISGYVCLLYEDSFFPPILYLHHRYETAANQLRSLRLRPCVTPGMSLPALDVTHMKQPNRMAYSY